MNLSLFPANLSNPTDFLKLENRRYIGNKSKLTNWIFEIIQQETSNSESFCDIFSGTGAVANVAFQHFKKVIVNDLLYSNNVIYKAFFEKSAWDTQKINALLNTYNSLNPDDLAENYFSENFGGKFFEHSNSKIIGFIREDLEQKKSELNEKEFCILLAILIYSMDKIANTVGHFEAYLKKETKTNKLVLKMILPNEFEGIEIYNQDANILAKNIQSDIVYIDPPYNSRQYNRFYHVYENLVQWQKPELFGVALKPKPENSSAYCTVKAKYAFNQLIKDLNAKYLVVSYNNTYNSKSSSSENKITLAELEEMLNTVGETKRFESSYKPFNTGKTTFEDHKELLFITKKYE